MIDWIRLFQDNGIHYATAGPNVSRGWVGVKCPFCGANDPSEHLGIHLSVNRWSCWRDKAHSGASPYRLISALLGVSGAQAKHIVGAYTGAGVDEFDALPLATATLAGPLLTQTHHTLPPEFIHIEANTLTHKFWLHIKNRGFDDPDKVINDYNLKCCLVGRWKGRLIIPVYGARSTADLMRSTFNREIVGLNPTEPTIIGWQARSLRTIEGVPRYLTSGPVVKKTLFNLQNLDEGEVLYICEGPFDCIKIDYYGKPRIRATCIFGSIPTPEQVEILYNLSSKFSKLVLALDNDATGITAGFSLSDWLPNIEFGNFPEGHKDTDLLTPQEMKGWLYG